MNAKRSKRSSTAPTALQGRNENHSMQRSARQVRRFGAVPRTAPAHDHTGAFGPFRKPSVKGVDPSVAYSNRMSAKAARRAENQWRRSLPKGVKI
jgi:hypothetical protein